MSNKDYGLFILFAVVVTVLVFGVSLWITYAVATSNLPDWVKFLLLR